MKKIPPRLKTWSTRVFTAGLGQVFTYGSRFVRNIILARLLLPDEFGTAVAINAMFGLAVATDLGLDRFVMLRGTERSLSAAHLLSVIRGFLVALAFVIFAPQAAALFGVPDFSRSFALAAGISAIEGLHHFGIRQIWRNHEYGPDTKAQIAASIGAIVSIFPAIAILHDHRAIIVSLATETLLYTALSHFLAPSSFRMRSDKIELRSALRFSLPLMLNGVGLAIIQQLDRFLVGYWFGVTELALYAVLVSLSVVPGSLLLAVFSNVGLSYLIGGQEQTSSHTGRYHILFNLYTVLSLSYLFFLILVLDILAPAIFGPSFAVSPLLQAAFAIIGYLRLLRAGAPTTLLLAQSRTRQLALLNLSAGLGFLIGLLGVALRPELGSMLAGFALGEVITYVLFLAMVKQSLPTAYVGSALATTLLVPAVIVGVFAWMPQLTLASRGTVFLAGTLAIGAQLTYMFLRDGGFRALFSHTAAADTKG